MWSETYLENSCIIILDFDLAVVSYNSYKSIKTNLNMSNERPLPNAHYRITSSPPPLEWVFDEWEEKRIIIKQ